MDTKGHDASPRLSPRRQWKDHLSSPGCQEAPGGDHTAPHSSSQPLQVQRVCAWSLACETEERDDSIRELREQVQNGTYRVSAEHIAEKLLLDMLYEQLA